MRVRFGAWTLLAWMASPAAWAAALSGPVPDSLAPRTQAWTVYAIGLQAEFDGNHAQALELYLQAEALGIEDPELFARRSA
jgi:hypothetical protein